MPVFQAGSINTTALIVPDLYVQIVPPRVSLLNGVATNKLGIVGIATWGPTNVPVPVGDMADYSQKFGPMKANKFDLGTAVAAAVLQGANNMACVRVTDGTDVASTSSLVDITAVTPIVGVTLDAKYTGTLGDTISRTVSAGTAAGTFKITIVTPNSVPEVFDNIGGATPTDVWDNMVLAINLGQSGVRGPSQLVVATIGAATAAPALGTATLSGGTDGNTTITATVLVGVDTSPRKGMYSLRSTGTSIAMLADADDTTQWAAQVAFGLSEGIYMIGVGPAGQTVAAAVTAKTVTTPTDSYAMKILMGDWIYFQDTVNNQLRLISPQGFVAGRLANLSPEQSSLNKPIHGIVATEITANSKTYSSAELAVLVNAGIDVVTAPSPGGNYFACRVGHNSSSNPMVNGDNYTRMTNYIAYTLNAGMGRFIGRTQTKTERGEAWATIDSFLAAMENLTPDPMIDSHKVTLDASNNPASRVALGYQTADVQVKYLSIVEKFIINVEGGTSVQINRVSVQPA